MSLICNPVTNPVSNGVPVPVPVPLTSQTKQGLPIVVGTPPIGRPRLETARASNGPRNQGGAGER